MKFNKTIGFTFLFIILVLPLLPAQDPTFQFNKQFDLKRPCSDRGFFCNGNFECNITLINPVGDVIISNQVMTNNVSYRNITVPQVLNNQLGIITATESCNNVTNAGLKTFDVAITADGKEFQAFPNQFVILILALLFVAVGTFNDRLRLFKHLGSILLIIIGIITLYPGYNFINWTTLLGKGLGFVLIGLGFYFFIEDSFSRDKQEEYYDSQSEFVDE